MASLIVISGLALVSPYFLVKIVHPLLTYDLNGVRIHQILGKILTIANWLWVLVFAGFLMKHRKRALWGLSIYPLLYVPNVIWEMWSCC